MILMDLLLKKMKIREEVGRGKTIELMEIVFLQEKEGIGVHSITLEEGLFP